MSNMNIGDYYCRSYNSGDYNSGSNNTGQLNSGDYNTGHRNTGDRNTGDRNTGHMNTGDMNTGDLNTGNYNIGDYNIGYFNIGNYNTGFFCENNGPVMFFDRPCTLNRMRRSVLYHTSTCLLVRNGTVVAGCLWSVRLHTAEDSAHIVSPAETEALAMAAADAIYDPPAEKIKVKDRGPNWLFVAYIRSESP